MNVWCCFRRRLRKEPRFRWLKRHAASRATFRASTSCLLLLLLLPLLLLLLLLLLLSARMPHQHQRMVAPSCLNPADTSSIAGGKTVPFTTSRPPTPTSDLVRHRAAPALENCNTCSWAASASDGDFRSKMCIHNPCKKAGSALRPPQSYRLP